MAESCEHALPDSLAHSLALEQATPAHQRHGDRPTVSASKVSKVSLHRGDGAGETQVYVPSSWGVKLGGLPYTPVGSGTESNHTFGGHHPIANKTTACRSHRRSGAKRSHPRTSGSGHLCRSGKWILWVGCMAADLFKGALAGPLCSSDLNPRTSQELVGVWSFFFPTQRPCVSACPVLESQKALVSALHWIPERPHGKTRKRRVLRLWHRAVWNMSLSRSSLITLITEKKKLKTHIPSNQTSHSWNP